MQLDVHLSQLGSKKYSPMVSVPIGCILISHRIFAPTSRGRMAQRLWNKGMHGAPPMPTDPTPLHRPLLIAPPPTQLTVYTDGSCLQNGTDNTRSGGGVWFTDDHPLNRAIRVPGHDQSNQVGELAAVVVALKSTPQNADLTIVTDSQYVITCLTNALPQWEDSGWPRVPNAPWIKAAAYAMRRQSAPT